MLTLNSGRTRSHAGSATTESTILVLMLSADHALGLRPGENQLTLVLGGARSGKSEVAESLIAARAEQVTYVATARRPAPGGDRDFEARIEDHRRRRPPAWATIEVADDLPEMLAMLHGAVLVDSLGTWVAGLDGFCVDIGALCRVLIDRDGPTVVVSDEVGLGVVPATAVGGAFRDALGQLNHAVADIAGDVILVVAGRQLRFDAR